MNLKLTAMTSLCGLAFFAATLQASTGSAATASTGLPSGCKVVVQKALVSEKVVKIGLNCDFQVNEIQLYPGDLRFSVYKWAWSAVIPKKGTCDRLGSKRVTCSGLERLNPLKRRFIWIAVRIRGNPCVERKLGIGASGGHFCVSWGRHYCNLVGILGSIQAIEMPGCGSSE